MTRFLTLIVAAATLSLASCASSQKEECTSCCKADTAKKACCDKDKSSAHKH